MHDSFLGTCFSYSWSSLGSHLFCPSSWKNWRVCLSTVDFSRVSLDLESAVRMVGCSLIVVLRRQELQSGKWRVAVSEIITCCETEIVRHHSRDDER